MSLFAAPPPPTPLPPLVGMVEVGRLDDDDDDDVCVVGMLVLVGRAEGPDDDDDVCVVGSRGVASSKASSVEVLPETHCR